MTTGKPTHTRPGPPTHPEAGGPSPALSTGEATIIVAFGDSVTRATPHVTAEQSFVALLQRALSRRLAADCRRVSIVNSGVGGENSAEGLARIQEDVLDHRPALVLIEFGLNDVRYEPEKAIGLDDFKANLKTMIRRISGAGARGLLITPNPIINPFHVYSRTTSFYDRWGGCDQRLAHYADAVRAVARAERIALCDIRRAFIDRAIDAEFRGEADDYTDLTALASYISPDDGVHPITAGHELIAAELYRLLARQPALLDRP